MSKLDTLTGFRGGVVYAAAEVLPATVHSWSLEIGSSTGAGHKRYDAFDAIMLALMQVLTVDVGLPASRAAFVLNGIRNKLRAAVEAIEAEQEESGRYRWSGGPYLLIQPSRMARRPAKASIVDEHQLLALLADQDSGMTQIVVPLPRNVCRTLVSLQTVLAGDKPPHRED